MYDDVHVLRDRARAAMSMGDWATAVASLRAAAEQTHLEEAEYQGVLRGLEEALTRVGDARAALTVIAALGSSDRTAWRRAAPLLPHVPPVDRAWACAARGQLLDAARELEGAGRFAGAAVQRERAADWPGARGLWAKLAASMGGARGAGDVYVAALVRFNLARCARRAGDAAGARDASVTCVRLLEEAADHFESMGQRERAFDCFQVLVQLGREGGAFEDVLEGSVNSIRILREDHLRQFALDYFEAAIDGAVERGETSAAATFAREAADYARSLGQTIAATSFSLRQSELWRMAATQQADRGAPPEMVAHALLASILASASVGQYARVGQRYAELAQLDLDPSRRDHYARAAERYARVPDEPLDKAVLVRRSPPSLGQNDVWHLDVLEWEQRGSAAEVCADMMLDRRSLELVRRKAMLVRLSALRVEEHPADRSPQMSQARVRLADQLSQLQHYAVLAPLETLFAMPERAVKLAVLGAMQTLFYKRTLITVRAALRDADPMVVQRATDTLRAQHLEHALDPLTRILHESSAAPVRAAALWAIARVDTRDAAEVVIGALAHGTPDDRAAALLAVHDAPAGQLVELARDAWPSAKEPLKSALRAMLEARHILPPQPPVPVKTR